MAVEIKQPNLLIVEGKEEEYFFEALTRALGLSNIQILPIGGKQQLRHNLKALKLSAGFPEVVAIGIVRDANADPRAAFQSIRDALQVASLPSAERPFVPAGESPRIIVMILPQEDTAGMLEDLCLRAVDSDPAMLCVDQYFQCLKDHDLSLPHNMAKAKLQAFLASRPEPGKRLGEAAKAGYWPWDNTAFDIVKRSLQQLRS